MRNLNKTSAYHALVKQYYPNAVYFEEFGQTVVEMMRRNGYPPEEVMLANSICSDDVNAMQFPPSLAKFLGPFNMGGLDGFPFTGITGMSAFSHHAPDNGILMIFFAPHIGISLKGYPLESVGKIQREGQKKLSDACGAVRAALNTVLSNQVDPKTELFIPKPAGPLDMQQDTIVHILWEERERIRNSKKDPMIEATQIMFENIKERLKLLLPKDGHHPEIILIGGIYINVDADYNRPFFCFDENHCFEIIELAGKKEKAKKISGAEKLKTKSFTSRLAKTLKTLSEKSK